jgi:single-stranded-DNA-specific exonuclease
MQILTKKWETASRIPPQADAALQAYPPLLRQILYNRGYATPQAASEFLEARAPEGSDPFAMLGVPAAVERIDRAIRESQPVAVYGDYDADGVTATALLVQALRGLGAKVTGYIPNRFDEGYGLNNEALSSLYQEGVRLVITVDCGVRSLPEAAFARSLGLDMIITDHHQPAAEMPEALAVVNPKQPGDTYPDKDLAGVGLAYKLACALLSTHPQAGFRREDLLDLVALGTVADLAPLSGENRHLVKAGLEYLRRPIRQGLMALISIAGLTPARITATEIGFALGPRLNAAGRLDSALAAYNLLLTRDIAEAAGLAQRLEIQNRERQAIMREIQERAEQMALTHDPNALLLFAAHPDFNPGVIGLAASRLTDKYYRPAIVAQIGEEFTRGSCRSIPEFHITAALDQCTGLLEHHGGHAAAAGFTVRSDRLLQLIDKLQGIASAQLAATDLRPTLLADAEIPLSDLHADLITSLDRMQPTGYGNRQAQFITRDLHVSNARSVGRDSAHLKLVVTDGRVTYDAIAFRLGGWLDHMPPKVDLLYTFETNEFNGRTTLQLNVKDINAAGA